MRVINAYTTGDQERPVSVSLGESGFFVAWTDESGLDGNGNGVFGRFVDPDGVPVGGDIQINSDAFIGLAIDHQSHIQLDRLSTGEIIAVWEAGHNQDGSLNGVFGRKIGLDGTLGEEIQINQTTASALR